MRWGMIGTRGLVDKGGLNAFREAENAELVAALSSDPERAKEFGAEHGVETATADLDEFLAAPGLEAVWIASPTWRHHEQGEPRSRPASTSCSRSRWRSTSRRAGTWSSREGGRRAARDRLSGTLRARSPQHEAADRRGRDRRRLGGQDLLRDPSPGAAAGVAPEARYRALGRSVRRRHPSHRPDPDAARRDLRGQRIPRAPAGVRDRRRGGGGDQARVGRGRDADDQHQRVDPVHAGRGTRHRGGARRPGHLAARPGKGHAAPRAPSPRM